MECMFPNGKILEVGCGDNPITKDTPDIETTLVDYRLDIAMFAGCSLLGDTTRIPFLDESLGGIVCQHVIEHHTHGSFGDNPSYGTLLVFLQECYRVLKPGGFIESICPNLAYLSRVYWESGYDNVGIGLQIMQWMMGGQRDKYDHHGCILDAHILGFYAHKAKFRELELLDHFDAFGLHVLIRK